MLAQEGEELASKEGRASYRGDPTLASIRVLVRSSSSLYGMLAREAGWSRSSTEQHSFDTSHADDEDCHLCAGELHRDPELMRLYRRRNHAVFSN